MADHSIHPDARIARLEELFASLPGLGPRSAARLVTDLLTDRRREAEELVEGLGATLRLVHHCPNCHTLTTQELCGFCADKTRDQTQVCVVESVADQKAVEASIAYKGGYFVLMGRVNPIEGTEPQDLGLPLLMERIERDVERDYFMTAEEALAYGIIDEIYQPRKK